MFCWHQLQMPFATTSCISCVCRLERWIYSGQVEVRWLLLWWHQLQMSEWWIHSSPFYYNRLQFLLHVSCIFPMLFMQVRGVDLYIFTSFWQWVICLEYMWAGGLLDLYGADGDLTRQVLQVCLRGPAKLYTGGYSRQNHCGSKCCVCVCECTSGCAWCSLLNFLLLIFSSFGAFLR